MSGSHTGPLANIREQQRRSLRWSLSQRTSTTDERSGVPTSGMKRRSFRSSNVSEVENSAGIPETDSRTQNKRPRVGDEALKGDHSSGGASRYSSLSNERRRSSRQRNYAQLLETPGMTPRTAIQNFLKHAPEESPIEAGEQRAQLPQNPTPSQTQSFRLRGYDQLMETPGMTPRTALKTFLRYAPEESPLEAEGQSKQPRPIMPPPRESMGHFRLRGYDQLMETPAMTPRTAIQNFLQHAPVESPFQAEEQSLHQGRNVPPQNETLVPNTPAHSTVTESHTRYLRRSPRVARSQHSEREDVSDLGSIAEPTGEKSLIIPETQQQQDTSISMHSLSPSTQKSSTAVPRSSTCLSSCEPESQESSPNKSCSGQVTIADRSVRTSLTKKRNTPGSSRPMLNRSRRSGDQIHVINSNADGEPEDMGGINSDEFTGVSSLTSGFTRSRQLSLSRRESQSRTLVADMSTGAEEESLGREMEGSQYTDKSQSRLGRSSASDDVGCRLDPRMNESYELEADDEGAGDTADDVVDYRTEGTGGSRGGKAEDVQVEEEEEEDENAEENEEEDMNEEGEVEIEQRGRDRSGAAVVYAAARSQSAGEHEEIDENEDTQESADKETKDARGDVESDDDDDRASEDARDVADAGNNVDYAGNNTVAGNIMEGSGGDVEGAESDIGGVGSDDAGSDVEGDAGGDVEGAESDIGGVGSDDDAGSDVEGDENDPEGVRNEDARDDDADAGNNVEYAGNNTVAGSIMEGAGGDVEGAESDIGGVGSDDDAGSDVEGDAGGDVEGAESDLGGVGSDDDAGSDVEGDENDPEGVGNDVDGAKSDVEGAGSDVERDGSDGAESNVEVAGNVEDAGEDDEKAVVDRQSGGGLKKRIATRNAEDSDISRREESRQVLEDISRVSPAEDGTLELHEISDDEEDEDTPTASTRPTFVPVKTPQLPLTTKRVQSKTPQRPGPSATSTPTSTQPAPRGSAKANNNQQKGKRPAKKQSKKTTKKPGLVRFPASLTKSIFTHFSQSSTVSKDVMAEVEKVADKFWKNLIDDLGAFAHHAHRETVTEADVELLMRRQGFVTDKRSLYTLVDQYLPLEYRQQIIPVARSGNVVVPRL